MPRLSELVFRTARQGGLTAAVRWLRPGAPVLCYHNIVRGPVSAADQGLHLERERFHEQMTWCAGHFTVVPLDELHARATAGRSVRGLAAVTFDDAYQGTLSHGLDVLRALALPSTVFVPSAAPSSGRSFWWDQGAAAGAESDPALRTRFLETLCGDADAILAGSPTHDVLPAQCMPASWDQLRGVDRTMVTLGAHSVNHRTLPRLDDEALDAELAGSADTIQRETGARPQWFAYPYGRWDARVAAACRRAGYVGAFTLDRRDVTAATDWSSAPRINIPAAIGFDAFTNWVSGFMHLKSLRA